MGPASCAGEKYATTQTTNRSFESHEPSEPGFVHESVKTDLSDTSESRERVN